MIYVLIELASYIVKMVRKGSKLNMRITTSSISSVDKSTMHLDVDHEKKPIAHITDQGSFNMGCRAKISFSIDFMFGKIID
jgi:hypothetical protein